MNLFLDKKAASWNSCLDHAWMSLRASWPHHWVGLPKVMQECIEFLDFRDSELTSDVKKMLSAALEVSESFERMYLNAPHIHEPNYHNRLHTADVTVAMSLQMLIETEQFHSRKPEWMAAGLLAAVVHDFEHPGRINIKPAEIEKKSLAAVMPILEKHHTPLMWIDRIKYAVERSDFSMMRANHLRVENQTFEWSQDWLTILLNEADIMASCVSEFSEDLSLALSEEWKLIDYPAYKTIATKAGRLNFLQNVIFSSRSSDVLNVNNRINQKINAIDSSGQS